MSCIDIALFLFIYLFDSFSCSLKSNAETFVIPFHTYTHMYIHMYANHFLRRTEGTENDDRPLCVSLGDYFRLEITRHRYSQIPRRR